MDLLSQVFSNGVLAPSVHPVGLSRKKAFPRRDVKLVSREENKTIGAYI